MNYFAKQRAIEVMKGLDWEGEILKSKGKLLPFHTIPERLNESEVILSTNPVRTICFISSSKPTAGL